MTTQLGVNVFTAPEKAVVGERPRPIGPPMAWDAVTSTLLFGERDAVLIDAPTTSAGAEALAGWVALHHRNLTTIYITHGHVDHFTGLSVLLQRFPEARAIATPRPAALTPEQTSRLAFFRGLWPGQLPAAIAFPEPYDRDVLNLEDHEGRIIQQGHTDTVDTTSFPVPPLDLVGGGDVVYNECHIYVAESTPDSRANWIAALDRLAALNPRIVVAGTRSPAPRT